MQKIQERQLMTNEHIALKDILQSRGMKKLQGNYPLWKFKLTDDEYEYRKQQCQLLYDRYRDWAEYARLYIYRNQIIPTHYNEFMTEYHRLNKGLWFVKKSLRIIETCE